MGGARRALQGREGWVGVEHHLEVGAALRGAGRAGWGAHVLLPFWGLGWGGAEGTNTSGASAGEVSGGWW